MNITRQIFRALLSILLVFGSHTAMALSATTVSLQTSSDSVTGGTAITLTATVASSGTPVFPGEVVFCDATAPLCAGTAQLAMAQVLSGGTATARLLLGPGAHSVKAVFLGTGTYGGSSSAASSITVSGHQPSVTTLNPSGNVGSYTLTATVGFNGLSTVGLPDSVSFTDSTNGNLSVGSAALTGLSAPAYSFAAVTGSPVTSGKIPSHVAIADVDGDGIPDMIVTNLGDNTVSVLHGNGGGGFAAANGSPYAVGGSPTSVAVGDFNDDGYPDFVVTNTGAGTAAVFLNRGDGTFAAGTAIAVGNGPQAVVVGDFNFDGNLDLAVANVYSSTVSVLLGDGTGHFTSAAGSPVAVGNNPMALLVADLNGDGYADLAVANTSDATVSVLLGRGDGTFQAMAASPFPVGATPEAMTAADLNGDGKLDLAVAGSSDNSIAVLLNGGNTFTPAGVYQGGANPSSIAAGDLNGDGKLDLLITNTDDGTATVLAGNGDGTFTIATQSPLQSFDGPLAAALTDLNGDGTLDAVVANAGYGTVSVRALKVFQTATAELGPVVVPGNGTHQIAASFAGNTNYDASTSTPIALTASVIPTGASIQVSPGATVMYGQTVQLTESITPSTADHYMATGTGTFTDAGATLSSAPLTNGQALLSVNSLAVGHHTLGSSYSGDADFAGSTATGTALTVTQATTVTALSSSAGTVTAGTGVILQATVAATTRGVPTGTVSFYDNGGSVAMAQAPLVNGVASFQVTAVGAGNNSYSAIYSGDTDYLTSTSQTAAVNNADFALTAGTSMRTVAPGQSTNFNFTISPTSGSFNAPVTFAVSGLPNGTTASFSPATVTPNGATVQTTLTLTTSLQASMERSHRNIEAACVGLLALLPFATRRRSRLVHSVTRKGALLVAVGVLAFGVMGYLTGCSTGNGYQQIPSANYTLTVTATSGTLVHSSQVTLNLQ